MRTAFMMLQLLVLLSLTSGVSAEWVQLHEAVKIPVGWKAVVGGSEASAVFHVTMGLKRSEEGGKVLEKVVDEVSDPKNEKYLRFLSREEARELLRPGEKNVEKIVRWMRSYELAPVVNYDGDLVSFEANSTVLGEMFRVKFSEFKNIEDAASIIRGVGPVWVPKMLGGNIVEVVTGFRGFPTFRTTKKNVRTVGQVTPELLKKTYNVTQVVATSGQANLQSITQFQGQYVSPGDLSKFCLEFSSDKKSCGVSFYIGDNNENEPGLESMTDTEYLITMGSTETTWVYSYPGNDFCASLISLGSNVTATPIFPWVISISYGSQLIDFCSKDVVTRFTQDCQKLSSLGVSIIVSSGDDGSGGNTDRGSNDGKLNPSFPASVPYVTAVGGTFFVQGTVGVEQATTEFGSGGGFSYDFPVPQYQRTQVASYLNNVIKPPEVTYGSGRGTPDVSLLAQSYTVLDDGSWYAQYGTSCSAPVFSGMINQLNELCLQHARRPLGFLNPLLYQNPAAFTDITLGGNAIGYNSQAGWYAIEGWDAATGLGTPKFDVLRSVVVAACKQVGVNGSKSYFSN